MNIKKISFEYIKHKFYMIIYYDNEDKKYFKISDKHRFLLFDLFLDIELGSYK